MPTIATRSWMRRKRSLPTSAISAAGYHASPAAHKPWPRASPRRRARPYARARRCAPRRRRAGSASAPAPRRTAARRARTARCRPRRRGPRAAARRRPRSARGSPAATYQAWMRTPSRVVSHRSSTPEGGAGTPRSGRKISRSSHTSASDRRHDVTDRARELVGALRLPEPDDEVIETGLAVGVEVAAHFRGVAVEWARAVRADEYALPEAHGHVVRPAAVGGDPPAQRGDARGELRRCEVG